MKDRELVRRYGGIDPEERFRLMLEACARDDHHEADRLASSCPMRSFSITDPAYMDRVTASRDLAVTMALELGPRLALLQAIETTTSLTALALAAAGLCGLGDVELPDADEVFAGLLSEARSAPMCAAQATAAAQLRASAASVYQAFVAVCREEMGLEPDVVLDAHLSYTRPFSELGDIEANLPQLAAWHDLFRGAWQARIGGPSRARTRERA